MDSTSFQTLARWAGGTLMQGDPARAITRVATDSRALQPGDFFVALRGENFDGHAFVAQAAALGAAGALVSTGFDTAGLPGEFGLIRVEDSLAALQAIATAYRASLPLRVLGVTGSSGKTSTKDFAAAVLGAKYRVLKTEGNFNNHIGLPLTILRAGREDAVGVLEMGMNHAGEIAPLAAIAAPEAAIITNIGVAHIEFLGSRAAIAQEKGMLAEALPPGGTLLLKADDDFSAAIAARSRAKTVLVALGEEKQAAVRAEAIITHFGGTRFRVIAEGEEAEVDLPVPGAHMVENALLALAAGRAFGVTLAEGAAALAACRLTAGRLERRTLGGIHFLDDSYNANPDSMRAALRTLAALPTTGARLAVLGRMGELGAEAEAGHRAVGEAAAEAKLDTLIAVGAEAHWIAEAARAAGLGTTGAIHHVADTTAAAELLASLAHPGDLVLLKGSRAARMERVLEHPAFSSQRNPQPAS